jgi:hypothetical protein
MKKNILTMAVVIALGSVTASTYLITIDKKFGSYYNTTSKWAATDSEFTTWLDINTPYNLSEFTPLILNQDIDFIQNQTFDQDQTRYEQKRNYDPVTSGYRNVGLPILEENTIVGNNTRTVEVIDLGWNDVGIVDNCNIWTPEVESILFGEEFTQERQCEQAKKRTLEYYIESNLETNYVDNQTFPVLESQQASGTNSTTGWVESDPTFTSWKNTGEGYNHVGWTPELAGMLVDFSQEQDYDQDQSQIEQDQEFNNFTSEYRHFGEPIEHLQTLIETENRDITVLVSEWVNDSTLEYDCTEWLPTIESQEYGIDFQQSSDCSQDQIANVEYKFVEEILNTEDINKTITVTNNQQATGNNSESGWVTIASDFTAWVDSSIGYDHLVWTPAISSQIANFNQSRDYLQDQEQFEQPKEQNSYTDEIRNLGSQTLLEQTISESENRSIVVTNTGWLNNGAADCTSWIPNTSTVMEGESFQQERSCDQLQKNTYSYKYNSSELDTNIATKTVTQSGNQQNTGTSQVTSCKDILDKGFSNGNGFYDVRISGTLTNVECDMTTNGGGWQKVIKIDMNDNSAGNFVKTIGFVGNYGSASVVAFYSQNTVNAYNVYRDNSLNITPSISWKEARISFTPEYYGSVDGWNNSHGQAANRDSIDGMLLDGMLMTTGNSGSRTLVKGFSTLDNIRRSDLGYSIGDFHYGESNTTFIHDKGSYGNMNIQLRSFSDQVWQDEDVGFVYYEIWVR